MKSSGITTFPKITGTVKTLQSTIQKAMFQLKYNKKITFRFVKSFLLIGSALFIFSACKKDSREEIFPASLTVVNAIDDASSFMTVYFGETTPKYYINLAFIENGKSLDYATNKTNQRLMVFLNHDTLNKAPITTTRLSVESAGIYTHFIYGNPTQLKEKTIKENLPQRSLQDSAAQLRIINLYHNRSIDVIQLQPAGGTIVSDLKYEQLSAFISVPINGSFEKFQFQINDHETGDMLGLLEEYNLFGGGSFNTNWLFKPRTMIVSGMWAGAGSSSAKVSTIGHF